MLRNDYRDGRVKTLTGYPWEAVRALELIAGDYAVFGSAPLLAYGLIAEVGDIDILATRSAWRSACARRAPVTAPGGDRVIHLTGDIDIFSGWLGLDVDAIISRAETVDGLPVAQLSDVAAYKRLLDRPKDRAHLELLEAFMTARRQNRGTLD